MKYVKWTGYGGPEVLKLASKEIPQPKDHEILVKIHATSVNAGDCELRGLKFPFFFKLIIRLVFGFFRPKNKVLGQELSGVVEAIGKDVTRFKVGDSVFGTTGFNLGAYSEYMTMSELPKTGSVALKPSNFSFEQAASIPVGGLEALHFLNKVELKKGQKILVNGAGGSIGTMVIQMANHSGAVVTAVDSSQKLGFLSKVGASYTIDYLKEDFTKNGETYDVIFDVVGKSNFSRSLESLNEKGSYIIANPNSKQKRKGKKINKLGSKKVFFDSANHSAKDLKELKDMVEAGILSTYIDKVFPMEDIVKAHEYVESGQKKGNLVIKVHDQ